MPARERIGARVGACGVLLVAASLASGAGCARSQGPPAIRLGTACAGCGMEVHDLRFACERGGPGAWRVYDAIECLIRDAGTTPKAPHDAWLADYDRQTLHPADSLWVVRGSFPSPMGGGFAAFLARTAADSVATATQGRVERLATWLATPPAGSPGGTP